MTAATVWERICRIAYCTFDLFSRIFVLSMSIMDVIDAFCWSPATKNDAVNESFVNISKWMSTIVENKENLLEGLTENKGLIERLLKYSPVTFDQLYSGVSSALDKTEVIHNIVQKISNIGGGIVVKAGKRIVNGAMVVSGLSNMRPTSLLNAR